MLVYNKYLKELGFKEKDFPFDKDEKSDPRYKLDKETGVVNAQTFSLDCTIVAEIYTYLRYFQDNCMYGIPAGFIDETKKDKGMAEWKKTVGKIVDGFRCYFIAMSMEAYTEEQRKELDGLFEQFDEAWALLGKNIQCFWW